MLVRRNLLQTLLFPTLEMWHSHCNIRDRLCRQPPGTMKLLIAYDGSRYAESALDDLCRAGLPDVGEVLVVTIAEVWLPPPELTGEDPETSDCIAEAVRTHREKGERMVNEAAILAKHAATRVSKMLPGWGVRPLATYGSPAWEIIAAADEFDPDLIIIGSHGRSVISRMVLGSISQKVLTEATCSVRIARGRIEIDPAPARLAIGFDGSAGATAAVESVCRRNWPADTEVQLIAATDSIGPTGIGRFIPPVAEWTRQELQHEYKWIEQLADRAAQKLEKTGLKVTTLILEGNPNSVIINEAENWHADCIFVGANAFGSRIERFLLGSTSAAVAVRAHCSVEVVRTKT